MCMRVTKNTCQHVLPNSSYLLTVIVLGRHNLGHPRLSFFRIDGSRREPPNRVVRAAMTKGSALDWAGGYLLKNCLFLLEMENGWRLVGEQWLIVVTVSLVIVSHGL